eukprot:10306918-Alexandrium_andersonii.AAC.1
MWPPLVHARPSSTATAASAAWPFRLHLRHQPSRWAVRARCPSINSPGRRRAASPPAPSRTSASG